MGSTGAGAGDRPRILFANEPRAYRDVLAGAVTLLRPDAEIVVAEPDELDAAIARHAPELVVCGRVTPGVEAGAHCWVLLYPDGQTFALVGRGHHWRKVPEVTLDGFMGIVTETLGPTPPAPGPNGTERGPAG
jgi:hypothetical protein